MKWPHKAKKSLFDCFAFGVYCGSTRFAMDHISAIIMAAGKGTRMNSEFPKVLHEIGGEPMVFHVIRLLQDLGIEPNVVVSYKKEEVMEAVKKGFDVAFVDQGDPLGTGHAVHKALETIPASAQHVLVMGGDDSAFYKPETIKNFLKMHEDEGATISFIRIICDELPTAAKIEYEEDGNFKRIVEKSDPGYDELDSKDINCGIYVFDAAWLRENIDKLELTNKGEYYVTHLLPLAKSQGKKIGMYTLEDPDEWIGVNTPEELERAQTVMKSRMVP